MTIEEKRRELFEAALRRDWAAHLVVLDRDGDGYVFGDIDSAWWGYNAALDAFEIELPATAELTGRAATGNEYSAIRLDQQEKCRAAIESTGLGLKVKP